MTPIPSFQPLALAAAAGPFLPPRASTDAGPVDTVFNMIFWICAAFLALILALTLRFVLKYRRRRFRGAEETPTHNTKLELLWTGIPLVLVFVIYGTAAAAYLDMTEGRAPQKQIQVTARKWSWWFDHPEGKGSNELHVVVGQRVELVMSAEDVLHSLYIPAFRVKQDLVPGRYTKLRFEPTMPGTYPIYCAEYCGENHSRMLTQVVVHADQAAYAKWVAQSAYEDSMPLIDVGKQVYETRGCLSCHSLDGTPRAGPTFKGLWGKTESFTDGSSATVDENYVRQSVIEPQAKIVSGFGAVMPPTPLDERELAGIIELVKSVKD